MATKEGPLAWMNRLSKSVHFYRPAPVSSPAALPSTSNAPRLILLASWMGAADPYIVKYLDPYRKMYPTSPILLVKSEMRHFLRPGTALREIAPALAAQMSVFNETKPDSSSVDTAVGDAPEMLVHVFSNGGSNSFNTIRNLWAKRDETPFPTYTLVMDSAPGKFTFEGTYSAMAAGLPPLMRAILAPMLYAMVTWFWIRNQIHRFRTGEDGGPLEALGKAFNVPRVKGRSPWNEVRRSYVYSKEDPLVQWDAVEAHARRAEEMGYNVRLERYDGSDHVAHMRRDKERYWRIAEETWEGRRETRIDNVQPLQ